MTEFTEADREEANRLLEGYRYFQAPLGRGTVAEGFYKIENGTVTVRGVEKAELIGTADPAGGRRSARGRKIYLAQFHQIRSGLVQPADTLSRRSVMKSSLGTDKKEPRHSWGKAGAGAEASGSGVRAKTLRGSERLISAKPFQFLELAVKIVQAPQRRATM